MMTGVPCGCRSHVSCNTAPAPSTAPSTTPRCKYGIVGPHIYFLPVHALLLYLWISSQSPHSPYFLSRYIFDGTFSDRTGSSAMLRDYTVPPYFSEDLFRLVGERRRPPYRYDVV